MPENEILQAFPGLEHEDSGGYHGTLLKLCESVKSHLNNSKLLKLITFDYVS